VDPSTGQAYVSGTEIVSVIDTRTREVIDTISGFTFHGIAVDPTTGNVYLTHGIGRDISVLGAPED